MMAACEQYIERQCQIARILKIQRLNQERVCTDVVCLIYVANMIRSGKHDSTQFKKFPLPSYPTEARRTHSSQAS